MTAQSKRRLSVVSISAGITAIVVILGYVVKAQDLAYNAAVRPKVEETAGQVVHDSIAECKAQMAAIAAKQCRSDSVVTVMDGRMLKIITLLEVMATNDELVKYKNRISNPTGIR